MDVPDRDVQHNISYSVIAENKGGAIQYSAAGEVNPRLTIEKNQIRDNCFKMYGNFSSCRSAVYLDLQNTQNLHFRVSMAYYANVNTLAKLSLLCFLVLLLSALHLSITTRILQNVTNPIKWNIYEIKCGNTKHKCVRPTHMSPDPTKKPCMNTNSTKNNSE